MGNSSQNTLKFAEITKESDSRPFIKDLWWESVVSFSGIIGLMGWFCAVFSIDNPYGITMAAAALAAVVMVLCYTSKRLRLLGLGILLLLLIGAVVWHQIWMGGFFFMINQMEQAIGAHTGKIAAAFSVSVSESQYGISKMAWIGLLTFLVGIPLFFSVRFREIWTPLLLSCAMLVLGCWLESGVPFLWIVLWLIYVAGLLFLRISKEPRVSVLLGLLITVLCIAGALISYFTGFLSTYQGMECFTAVQSDIKGMVHTMRYQGSRVLPDGKFQNLQPFHPSEKEQLEVVMSKPDSLYLKGFVGSRYTGAGWEPVPNQTLFESGDLFYWLHKENFYGQAQLAHLALTVDNSVTKDSYNQISIRNIGASSEYIYVPYELVSTENNLLDPDRIGDENILAQGIWGSRFYRYAALPNQVKRYPTLSGQLQAELKQGNAKDYLNHEDHYNEFVYASYLDMPESTRNLLKNQLGDYDAQGNPRLDYQAAKQNILSYLTDHVSYNQEAAFTGKEGDFLQDFLETSCEGYSVHYATAATLMFRYYGIPARYVEGFLITPEDVEGALSNSAISIDETHAHAWTEFYQDGVGWIPFETTPPYFNVMEKADELSGIPDGEDNSAIFQQNHDEKQEEEEGQGLNEMTQKNGAALLSVLLWTTICIVGLLILIFLAACAVRRHRLGNRLRSLEVPDAAESIVRTFCYTVDLLRITGALNNEKELYETSSAFYQWLGEDAELFQKAFRIYQEARYSRHTMSQADRQDLWENKERMRNKIQRQSNFLKRGKDRIIHGIY